MSEFIEKVILGKNIESKPDENVRFQSCYFSPLLKQSALIDRIYKFQDRPGIKQGCEEEEASIAFLSPRNFDAGTLHCGNVTVQLKEVYGTANIDGCKGEGRGLKGLQKIFFKYFMLWY